MKWYNSNTGDRQQCLLIIGEFVNGIIEPVQFPVNKRGKILAPHIIRGGKRRYIRAHHWANVGWFYIHPTVIDAAKLFDYRLDSLRQDLFLEKRKTLVHATVAPPYMEKLRIKERLKELTRKLRLIQAVKTNNYELCIS